MEKINPEDFSINRASFSASSGFIKLFHYSKGSSDSGTAYSLIYKEKYIVGVCIFATPISEEVRGWPFGMEHVNRVTELHRLAIIPKKRWKERPDCILSWFTSRCFKLLLEDKPHIRAVISFSDKSEGHKGLIYRALNAMYFGLTGRRRKYFLDTEGRLKSARSNGRNISDDEAVAKGWTVVVRDKKHKYMWILGPSVKERKDWKKRLLHKPIKWRKEKK